MFSPVHPQAVEFTPANSDRGQKHRGDCKAIRFRGENSLKAVNVAGTASGSGSCYAVECQRLGGSSGESHTPRLLWLFCTFSLDICSRPLLQAVYQAGSPPVWHEMCSNMCWQEQSEKTGYRSSSRNAKDMTCYVSVMEGITKSSLKSSLIIILSQEHSTHFLNLAQAECKVHMLKCKVHWRC
ncbi:hypothetical protein DV515_00006604 [Chloebia gouldiae]|uniref:Uncharacterized protein n=1 Tax=Chloebia gouldiae TaxID=44316 RepID=A0A3L8SK21_CHLGU|nr:hypothetical protein DV515_00006604 [Chloebia gouldiae]